MEERGERKKRREEGDRRQDREERCRGRHPPPHLRDPPSRDARWQILSEISSPMPSARSHRPWPQLGCLMLEGRVNLCASCNRRLTCDAEGGEEEEEESSRSSSLRPGQQSKDNRDPSLFSFSGFSEAEDAEAFRKVSTEEVRGGRVGK
eukprot:762823-Hanusia_phi.AAC.1